MRGFLVDGPGQGAEKDVGKVGEAWWAVSASRMREGPWPRTEASLRRSPGQTRSGTDPCERQPHLTRVPR